MSDDLAQQQGRNQSAEPVHARAPYTPPRMTVVDPLEVLPRLLQHAQGGNADAAYLLAVVYHCGCGVPRDPQQASFWLAYASQLGHPAAGQTLGNMWTTPAPKG